MGNKPKEFDLVQKVFYDGFSGSLCTCDLFSLTVKISLVPSPCLARESANNAALTTLAHLFGSMVKISQVQVLLVSQPTGMTTMKH